MKTSVLGILAASGLFAAGFASSASAADLGGDCCADLEERIAELEATTARKGNRKVSLTISGWVGEQVMWWDDDYESNTYVTGMGAELASNVRFAGEATIAPGWKAGYELRIEATGSDALFGIDQDTDNGTDVVFGDGTKGNKVSVVLSNWYIQSDQLGKVTVGMLSQPSNNAAVFVDGSGTIFPANFAPFDYGGFYLRDSTGAYVGGAFGTPGGSVVPGKKHLTIGDIMGFTDANGVPSNAVRYDTPTFAGFSASASWGEDDMWDVAVRYAGELSGFKVAATIAYSEATDTPLSWHPLLSVLGDAQNTQVGAYVQHVGTGLFLYGAWSGTDFDAVPFTSDAWYGKAGIRAKWNPLGATVPYFEYEHATIDVNGGPRFSTVDLWGVGILQDIDAAAMSVFLNYRNVEAELEGTDIGADFQYVKGGAVIFF